MIAIYWIYATLVGVFAVAYTWAALRAWRRSDFDCTWSFSVLAAWLTLAFLAMIVVGGPS